MATLSSILAWKIPIDRGAWPATVYGDRKELDATEWLSTGTYSGLKKKKMLRKIIIKGNKKCLNIKIW